MNVDLGRIRNLAGALRERVTASYQQRDRAAGKSWYRIDNKAGTDGEEAVIHIYDMIGEWGISVQDFVDELRGVTAKAVSLHVNSEGGEVFDGLAIYEAIATHPAAFTAYVDGLAASAASYIVCAAEKVVVAPRARMMIHDAHGFAMGNARDMRAMGDLLEDLSDNIADIYADKAGGTRASWRAAMQAASGGPDGTWYSADAAVKAGLADEVRGAEPAKGDGSEKAARAQLDVGVQDAPTVWTWDPAALVAMAEDIEHPAEPVRIPDGQALLAGLRGL